MGAFTVAEALSWQVECDSGRSNARGLFRFCLGALVRNLVRLKGADRFALHTVTREEIDTVQGLFRDNGIDLRVVTSACAAQEASVNLAQVLSLPRGLPLEQYELVIETCGLRHRLSFRLFHRTVFERCR